MERRKALSIAGVVVATVAAAAIAMAANLGLLGLAEADDDVGKLNAENVSELVPATSTTVTGKDAAGPEIVVVEEYVTDPDTSVQSGSDTPSVVTAPASPPVVAVPGVPAQPTDAYGGDDDDHDGYEDEDHEDEDHEDEDHEDEEHEGDHDDD